MIAIQEYQSPVGELLIGTHKDQIVLADWKYRKMRRSIDQRLQNQLDAAYVFEENNLQNLCIQQLQVYFAGKREKFDLPLNPVGTPFQKKVWQALQEIPYGKSMTYLSLSKKLGDVKAIRAVATANGANAISILIPCHRIVGSDGSLVGYAGGLSAKKKLLQLEKCEIFNQTELFKN